MLGQWYQAATGQGVVQRDMEVAVNHKSSGKMARRRPLLAGVGGEAAGAPELARSEGLASELQQRGC